MHKIVEEQDEAVDKVLGKHHKFIEFANNSSPVQNTVASSSTLPEKPVKLSLQDFLPPAPAFKSMKEYDEHEKKHRNRMKKAKKAKKDSVHLTPSEMEMTQNVQIFPEVSPNLISGSRELLFLEENLKVFPNSPSIINPKHPRAKYFKALIESLNLNDDEGYLNDLSLDMNHCTDKLSQVEYEEPLDWGTPSAQDDQSSDEDSISNELAATAGLSHLSLTLVMSTPDALPTEIALITLPLFKFQVYSTSLHHYYHKPITLSTFRLPYQPTIDHMASINALRLPLKKVLLSTGLALYTHTVQPHTASATQSSITTSSLDFYQFP
jgi:hypothetical protein